MGGIPKALEEFMGFGVSHAGFEKDEPHSAFSENFMQRS